MKVNFFLLLLGCICLSQLGSAQNMEQLEGRWDLQMPFEGKTAPSWLEIKHSGHETLVGRFVFAFGSARPISEIKTFGDNQFRFSIPRQWEVEGGDMVFHGKLRNANEMEGTLVYTDGRIINWTGKRAPKLEFNDRPSMGREINLFNTKDLDGWHVDREMNQWIVKDGILTSPETGANLISDQTFEDFKLNVEFRIPENGNSGIYLRGRYEVQIADNYGKDPSDIYFGGLYGFIEPNENAAKKAGEWQNYEITLNGRRVTVVANGKTVISSQTIPGITGGALDSNEGAPGPIMIQGDHGPVEFRRIDITPIN